MARKSAPPELESCTIEILVLLDLLNIEYYGHTIIVNQVKNVLSLYYQIFTRVLTVSVSALYITVRNALLTTLLIIIHSPIHSGYRPHTFDQTSVGWNNDHRIKLWGDCSGYHCSRWCDLCLWIHEETTLCETRSL